MSCIRIFVFSFEPVVTSYWFPLSLSHRFIFYLYESCDFLTSFCSNSLSTTLSSGRKSWPLSISHMSSGLCFLEPLIFQIHPHLLNTWCWLGSADTQKRNAQFCPPKPGGKTSPVYKSFLDLVWSL